MIFQAHLCLTWALLGSVWFVLIVHYPAFRFFPAEKFVEFEKFHIRRTNCLVIPIMVLEALTGLLLLMQGPVFILNAILIGIIWILTFTGCMPMHQKLKDGFSEPIYKKLIRIHAVRVGLWTFRGFLLFYALSM